MYNLKKALASTVALLTSTALLMSASPALAASQFADIKGSESYAEAVITLGALNILKGDDKGNMNPDSEITRAEVAAMICRIRGLETAASGAAGATAFTDVEASHWASGYINMAQQTGIINGVGDNMFKPADPVTYEQVVKMIVAALGYSPKAEKNGGYPSGYLSIASQEAITTGVAGTAGKPATRSTVARLIFNALTVKMMEQTVFASDSTEYAVVNKSLLVNFLNYDKIEGVVTATSNTDSNNFKRDADKTATIAIKKINGYTTDSQKINGFELLKSTDVELNTSPEFNVKDAEALNYLGYSVSAYISDDNDDKTTIVAIAPRTKQNREIVVPSSKMDGVPQMVKNKQFTYWVDEDKDKDTTKITIDNDLPNRMPIFVYNNTIITVDDDDDIRAIKGDSVMGTFTFISNDGDDDIDMIKILDVKKDVLVDKVEEARLRVSDKEDVAFTFADDEDDVEYNFIKDGKPAKFSDIKVGDVLSLAYGDSDDQGFIDVYISGSVVEGVVSEYEPKDNEFKTKYTIGGKQYKISRTFANNQVLKVNDNGKFYLNMLDQIVYKEASVGVKGNYALVFNAALDTGVSGEVVEIKLLNYAGEWVTKELAKTVNFNHDSGSSYTSTAINLASRVFAATTPDAVTALNTELKANAMGIFEVKEVNGKPSITVNKKIANANLIKYDVNSSGQINKIYVAGKGSGSDFKAEKTLTGEATYDADDEKLGSVYMKSTTRVFSAPAESAVGDWDDEDAYSVGLYSNVLKDNATSDYTNVYDIEEGGPTAIVVVGAESVLDPEQRAIVVLGISSTKNSNDDSVEAIRGLQGGAEMPEALKTSSDKLQVYLYNATTGKPSTTDIKANLNDIKAGDVITVGFDTKGDVKTVKVLMTRAAAETQKAVKVTDGLETNGDLDDNNSYFGWVGNTGSGVVKLYDRADADNQNTTTGGYVAGPNSIYDASITRKAGATLPNVYMVDLINQPSKLAKVSEYSDIHVETKLNKEAHFAYVYEYDGGVLDVVVYKMHHKALN